MKLSIIQPQCFLFPLFYYACNCQKYIIYKQKTKDVLFKLGVCGIGQVFKAITLFHKHN